ncbi:MAG: lysostaphin resistance A-like protein [Hyphomicrobiales bacterium]
MGKFWIVQLIILIVASLFILVGRKKHGSYKSLILFFMVYIISSFLNEVAFYYPSLDFIGGEWNWSGKLYSIVFSLLFILFGWKYFRGRHYFRIRQKRANLPIVVLVIVFILVAVGSYLNSSGNTFDKETMLFQLIMPTVDEEISFRGIMIVLLTQVVREYYKIGKMKLGRPSVWITAMVFALLHGLSFNDSWGVKFDLIPFLYTGVLGFLYGWITIRTKSILLPMISHSLNNVVSFLI